MPGQGSVLRFRQRHVTKALCGQSATTIGLLIAYVLPGFIALSGLQLFSPTLQSWLGAPAITSPTVSGFLYATLASIGLGLFVSTLRWLTVDFVHHRTGVTKPAFNYRRFEDKVPAMEYLVENRYRYYQA